MPKTGRAKEPVTTSAMMGCRGIGYRPEMLPVSGWMGNDLHARGGSGAGLVRQRFLPQDLPDTQTPPVFGDRGIPGQLVDQSCGEPHVGLQLRLISQEHARGPR